MNGDFNYEKWSDDYHNNRYINILRILSKKDIETIKKLNIPIEEKFYTKYELEILYLNLIQYCKDAVDEEELEEMNSLGILKSLDETEVSKEDYDNILKKVCPYSH